MAIIIADTPVIQPEGDGHKWSWYYRIEPPVNGVSDGTYERSWTDPPELEVMINADYAAQIAARANLEATTDEFSASSVYGGRIA